MEAQLVRLALGVILLDEGSRGQGLWPSQQPLVGPSFTQPPIPPQLKGQGRLDLVLLHSSLPPALEHISCSLVQLPEYSSHSYSDHHTGRLSYHRDFRYHAPNMAQSMPPASHDVGHPSDGHRVDDLDGPVGQECAP